MFLNQFEVVVDHDEVSALRVLPHARDVTLLVEPTLGADARLGYRFNEHVARPLPKRAFQFLYLYRCSNLRRDVTVVSGAI